MTGPAEGSVAEFQQTAGDTVFFAFDSHALTSEARSTLDRQAAWLQSNSGVTVRVEGNCDERGTQEYNLALGERRALAVRGHLISLGVSGDRLITISYGEELPADQGQNEIAWASNRRAHFAIR